MYMTSDTARPGGILYPLRRAEAWLDARGMGVDKGLDVAAVELVEHGRDRSDGIVDGRGGGRSGGRPS